MTPILEQEVKMRCLECAVTIAGRMQKHGSQEVIAIAKELCEYVLIGSSPTGSTTGEAGSKMPASPGRGTGKKTTK